MPLAIHMGMICWRIAGNDDLNTGSHAGNLAMGSTPDPGRPLAEFVLEQIGSGTDLCRTVRMPASLDIDALVALVCRPTTHRLV